MQAFRVAFAAVRGSRSQVRGHRARGCPGQRGSAGGGLVTASALQEATGAVRAGTAGAGTPEQRRGQLIPEGGSLGGTTRA